MSQHWDDSGPSEDLAGSRKPETGRLRLHHFKYKVQLTTVREDASGASGEPESRGREPRDRIGERTWGFSHLDGQRGLIMWVCAPPWEGINPTLPEMPVLTGNAMESKAKRWRPMERDAPIGERLSGIYLCKGS
jgi:hypothetical protein